MPTQVQTVLHRVPRLHQLAPEVFPAYDLPGVGGAPVQQQQHVTVPPRTT